MKLNFRILLIAGVVAGVAIGVAFGAGYALGSPRQSGAGLTAAQVIQMYGAPTSGQGGAGATTGGAAGRGGAGGGATILSRNPTGKITAMDATSITLDTRAGSQKLSLTSATTINKLSSGGNGDLKVGDTIVASGTAKSDGGFDASSVSQVPAELAALLDPAAGGGGTGGSTAPGRTPTPAGR